jgi:DsbC/DsbD-like thiol-disulfide interchange protein
MAKAGRHSWRELHIAVAVVALFAVGFLGLMLLVPLGNKMAARIAIRSGRVDPKEYAGWFSPEESQELEKEYQQHKKEADGDSIASPVAATIKPSSSPVHAGEVFEIVVTIDIKPGWHIYAVNRPAGISAPTAISLELPVGVEQAGKWNYPDPQLDVSASERPTFIYTNQTIFRCPVRVSSNAEPGEHRIGGKLQYQACDLFSCRPPDTIELQTDVQIEP